MEIRFGKLAASSLLLAVLALSVLVEECPAQLFDVDLSVDVTETSGLFTYTYELGNAFASDVSVNIFLMDVEPDADVTIVSQPDNWTGEYTPSERNLQVAWVAGDGIDFTNEDADIFPGENGSFSLTSSYGPGDKGILFGKVIPDGSDFLALAELMILAPTVPPDSFACDFDMDDDCDVVDIDELSVRIATGNENPLFDLTGDGATNADDLTAFLTDAKVNKLNGDLDFDGTVGFADFLVLSSNFGKDATWSGGDVSPDGSVGFADFLVLSDNFGKSSAALAAVPEPSGMLMWISAIAVLLGYSRPAIRRV